LSKPEHPHLRSQGLQIANYGVPKIFKTEGYPQADALIPEIIIKFKSII
jgi:hypothetical protein